MLDGGKELFECQTGVRQVIREELGNRISYCSFLLRGRDGIPERNDICVPSVESSS